MTVTPELTYEAHRAAMSNTDDADPRTVLLAILSCAQAWEGSVRILGNVRASDAVRALSSALSVPAAAVVGEQIEWLKARLADLQLPPGKRDHDTREKWLIQCGMPEAAPSAPEGWQTIETAPHGVTVLLATPPFKSMGEQAAWELRVGAASWGERIGGISNISRDAWATHWKPLPSPPTGGDSHE